MAEGSLIGTSEAPGPDGRIELQHELVPFWSYPYEWSFSMLRDAALLQLELQAGALDHDLRFDGFPGGHDLSEAQMTAELTRAVLGWLGA